MALLTVLAALAVAYQLVRAAFPVDTGFIRRATNSSARLGRGAAMSIDASLIRGAAFLCPADNAMPAGTFRRAAAVVICAGRFERAACAIRAGGAAMAILTEFPYTTAGIAAVAFTLRRATCLALLAGAIAARMVPTTLRDALERAIAGFTIFASVLFFQANAMLADAAGSLIARRVNPNCMADHGSSSTPIWQAALTLRT